MASISTPYGAQLIGDQSGTGRTLRMQLAIANSYAANIFKYQPVKMIAATGTIQAVTNPGNTPDPLWGLFAGCEYTPLGGRPAVSPFWPGGTTYDPNYDMFVYVWECWQPGARILVQADGSVPQASLGSSFNFTNLGAGSTSIGLSQCTVGAAGIAAGSQGQLTLIEFQLGPSSAVGDAFTDLICTVAYPQVGFRGQNSIG
jgi:hypothetical protein